MTYLGAIEEAKLLCTFVSDTSIPVLIGLSCLKPQYHDFAPALEVDQMVSCYTYSITLNGFLLLNTWGQSWPPIIGK
jgi:hypothetical protein